MNIGAYRYIEQVLLSSQTGLVPFWCSPRRNRKLGKPETQDSIQCVFQNAPSHHSMSAERDYLLQVFPFFHKHGSFEIPSDPYMWTLKIIHSLHSNNAFYFELAMKERWWSYQSSTFTFSVGFYFALFFFFRNFQVVVLHDLANVTRRLDSVGKILNLSFLSGMPLYSGGSGVTFVSTKFQI